MMAHLIHAVIRHRIGRAPPTNPSLGMTMTKTFKDAFLGHAIWNLKAAESGDLKRKEPMKHLKVL